MSDDVRHVAREEETVVTGQPPQTVVTETTAATPGVTPAVTPVAPPEALT